MKKLILFLSFFCTISILFAQTEKEDQNRFFFDAVCFKSPKDSTNKIDVIAYLPYQAVTWEKNANNFLARLDLSVKLFDSAGTKVSEKSLKKDLLEKDYKVCLGATGKFEYFQHSFETASGTYQVELTLSDALHNTETIKTRKINVVDFNRYNFSLSGIMLISSIEENAGKYKITPHIADNVSDLNDGFFAFFEVYNKKKQDSVDFYWELYNNGSMVKRSERYRKLIDSGTSRQFIRVLIPSDLKKTNYALRITALNKGFGDPQPTDFLAVTERAVSNKSLGQSVVIDDLPKAIRQLRYVADGNDIDYINEGKDQEEKQKRFDEFWKKIDPTPNSPRNEAFDEYYGRIDYADKNFKGLTEGWLSDMGMVYVVYGIPDRREPLANYGDSRRYEKWYYLNGREFIFADNSGFGDFRLVQPMSIHDKYRFRY